MKLKRLFILLLLTGVATFGFGFAVLNGQVAHLDFYYGAVTAPISLIFVVTLASGALLGILASLGLVVRYGREASRLRRRVNISERELKNLREMPFRDS